jgi:hypothetical protein
MRGEMLRQIEQDSLLVSWLQVARLSKSAAGIRHLDQLGVDKHPRKIVDDDGFLSLEVKGGWIMNAFYVLLTSSGSQGKIAN